MSTTWLTRLTNSHGHRPRLYFTIQGIPDVFQEDSVDIPSTLETSTRPRRKLIDKDGIKQSPTRLVMANRIVEGGTLTITLMDDNDGTLAALFTPRKFRSTYVEATCAVGDSSVDVKSTDAFSVGGFAYIGAETIRIAAKNAASFTGVARAQFNSVEQEHLGGSTDGDDVYTSPPSWKGRRVYLKSYWKNDDGTTTADLCRDEGVFVIEKAPKHVGDGKWVIQCSELTDEFYRRPIGAGLREVRLETPALVELSGATGLTLEVGAAAASQFFNSGNYDTQVMLTDEIDQTMAHDLVDADATSIDMSGVPQHIHARTLHGPHPIKSVRHVAVLVDTPAQIALMVLTSRTGELINGTFDQLPGIERSDLNGDAWRMGAGILHTEVDTEAFRRVGDSGSADWSFVIDSETTVAEFLFEFCLRCNCVAYVTRAGLLSVRAIASESTDASVNVSEDMLLPGERLTTEYDEDVIKPRASIECNYDPITKEYAGVVNMLDAKMQKKYPGEGESLRLASKTIVVEGFPVGKRSTAYGLQSWTRPTITLEALQNMLRQIMVSSGRGRAYVGAGARWHLDVMQIELGDLVNLSAPTPNMEGGDVNGLARLVEIGPEWDDASAVAVFEVVDKPYVIAPACPIASAASEVLTLEAGSIEAYEPATPGQMFADGSAVQVVEKSSGTIDDRTVVSHTDMTVTLNAAPSFVVAAGDMLRAGPQDDADANLTNDDGFNGLDFIYQMPDDENSATVIEVTRYR